jgi:lipoprotein-anchoring transpeptidase ErfK/SrfK
LAWGEPLVIRWNQELQDIQLQVSPQADVRSELRDGGKTAYVYFDPEQDAEEYQVTVTDAVGLSGTRLSQPATFKVDPAARPHLMPENKPLGPSDGDWIRLKWDQPIKDFAYQTDYGSGKWEVDKGDQSVVWILPEKLPQGSSVPVTITNAVTKEGAPLAAPTIVQVTTPPALGVTLDTDDDNGWTPVNSKLHFVLSEPPIDQKAFQDAISFDPVVNGEYRWVGPRTLEFVPENMAEDQVVRVAIKSGPDGPRAYGGGYVDEATAFKFVTAPNKTIDVSLSRQRMTLFEGDREVATFPVATGVRGADTPVGDFRVQYKMPVTRFVGINTVSRTRYDIPDVHWVMAFMGDYTIHGAYWRSGFGAPGSNGCVSLSDANAKIVFDWSPPGTAIHIHD